MPELIKNGKLIKRFAYDEAGKKACRNEALRTGGKCVGSQSKGRLKTEDY